MKNKPNHYNDEWLDKFEFWMLYECTPYAQLGGKSFISGPWLHWYYEPESVRI